MNGAGPDRCAGLTRNQVELNGETLRSEELGVSEGPDKDRVELVALRERDDRVRVVPAAAIGVA